MELALNLVWVAVAIAGIVLQWITLSRAARSSGSSASTTQKIVAMGCALVILFFVISMTDDLHDQQVLVEEKKTSTVTVGTQTPLQIASVKFPLAPFLVFLPPKVFSLAPCAVWGLIEQSEFLFVATFGRETLRGRAPPVSPA